MYLRREMRGCKDSQAVQEPKILVWDNTPSPPAALSTPSHPQKHSLPRARAGRFLLVPKAPPALPAAVAHQWVSGQGPTRPGLLLGGVCKATGSGISNRSRTQFTSFHPLPHFSTPWLNQNPLQKQKGGDTVPQGGRDGSPPAQHPWEAGEGWVGGAGLIPKGPIPNPD